MTVPPGWYADITLNTSWTLTRDGSSSQAIMLSLLCWVPLGPRLSAAIGEGSPPSRKTPAERFPPPNALDAAHAADPPVRQLCSHSFARAYWPDTSRHRSGKEVPLIGRLQLPAISPATSCARRTSPAKPMLSKLASCKTLASRAALPAAQHCVAEAIEGTARGSHASDSVEHDCATGARRRAQQVRAKPIPV